MDADEVRRFALSLPEATESPHFESDSFRVRGRIFATLPPDGEHAHVFVDEAEAWTVTQAEGPAFEELWWGKRRAGLRVHLPSVTSPELVHELIEHAWRGRAPKRLVAAYDART